MQVLAGFRIQLELGSKTDGVMSGAQGILSMMVSRGPVVVSKRLRRAGWRYSPFPDIFVPDAKVLLDVAPSQNQFRLCSECHWAVPDACMAVGRRVFIAMP